MRKPPGLQTSQEAVALRGDFLHSDDNLVRRDRWSHDLLGITVHVLNDTVHQPIDILRYVPIYELLATIGAYLGWHIAYCDSGVTQLEDHLYQAILNLLPTFRSLEGYVYIHLRFPSLRTLKPIHSLLSGM